MSEQPFFYLTIGLFAFASIGCATIRPGEVGMKQTMEKLQDRNNRNMVLVNRC